MIDFDPEAMRRLMDDVTADYIRDRLPAVPPVGDQLLDLVAWAKKIEELPPMPVAIHLHPAVPVGRLMRQWNTRGELHLWMNDWTVGMMGPKVREEIVGMNDLLPMYGIPIIYET